MGANCKGSGHNSLMLNFGQFSITNCVFEPKKAFGAKMMAD